jgi:hypothetical protein
VAPVIIGSIPYTFVFVGSFDLIRFQLYQSKIKFVKRLGFGIRHQSWIDFVAASIGEITATIIR